MTEEQPSMAARRAELLSDVAAHATQVLRGLGVATDVAEQCGAAIADHLADHYGGEVISWPKDCAYKLAARDREVLADREAGMSAAALSRKYGISERGINKLLSRARRRHVVDAQQDLFGSQPADRRTA